MTTDNHEFFTPELVDEQIDQLSLNEPGTRQRQGEKRLLRESQASYQVEQPEQRLVLELQTYYRAEQPEDLASLERAWKRVSAHLPEQQIATRSQDKPSTNTLRFPQERTRMMQSQQAPGNSKRRKLFRRLNMLAAVLIAGLLVGGMVVVFKSAQPHTAGTASRRGVTQTPTQPALQAVPSSPGLYLITQADKNQNSQVTKVDKNTGQVLWNHFIGTNGSPVVVADDLVFGSSSSMNSGTSSGASQHGYVYALNARNGAQIWQTDLGVDTVVPVLGPPTFADGVIYVTSAAGKVYALNAANGAVKWTYDTGTSDHYNSFVEGSDWVKTLAVANGVVYGATLNKVYAINAQTGKGIWSASADAHYTFGSPTVDSRAVYLSEEPPSTHTSANPNHSYIVAYSISNGTRLWKSDGYYWAGFLNNAPVVANGLVYVANIYTGIYALNSGTGKVKWQHALGTDAFTNSDGCSWPVVADTVVYANCGNASAHTQHLQAFNATTGVQLWSQSSVADPIAASNGVVYGTAFPGLVFLAKASDGTQISQHTYGLLVKNKFGDPSAPEPYLTLVP